MNIEEKMKNPDLAYRIKPFWFWNGEITKEEVKKQISEMKDKGLGGVFICPRQGQNLPYLSEKWFKMVEFACGEAKDAGLEAWLYDEYPYPSGMSGGEVLLRHPEAKHMILQHHSMRVKGEAEVKKALGWGEILYAKAFLVAEEGYLIVNQSIDLKDCIGNLQITEIYQKAGLTAYNNKRFFTYGPNQVLTTVLPKGEWQIEIYVQEAMGDFKYYGGFFDPCNEGAVRTFIETTHEKYAKQLGKNFGKTIFGMFSDEVGMLSPIPWSKHVPEEFRKRKGYSILENMPALHHKEWKDAHRIRYDLYDVIHQIFVESYHKQVSEWCQDNNLLYATEVPCMRLSTQRYSNIPGGDAAHEKAGKNLEATYEKSLPHFRHSVHAVGSIAKQLNRKQAMIESFHSVGWTMTMQDAKWMIDRLGSSGINLYNFHAFYYTIDAITKHDAPPSQFLQNPYWKEYRHLADYVGRMGAFISNTEDICSIAVLDPAPTLWALLGNPFQGFPYRGEDMEEETFCNQVRNDWVYTTKTILFNQLQFNHLDSEMLPQFRIKDGCLHMGRASYRLVVIPPALFYEKVALEKLEEFVAGGGHILFLGRLPDKSLDAAVTDQEIADRWRALYEGYPKNVGFIKNESSLEQAGIEKEFITFCREVIKEPFEVKLPAANQKEFITSIRKDKEGQYYIFIANQGMEYVRATIKNEKEDTRYRITRYMLEDGTTKDLGVVNKQLQLHFAPLQSMLVRFEETEEELNEISTQLTVITIPMQKEVAIDIDGGNVLRLEKYQMSRDKNRWIDTEVKTFIEQCSEKTILKPDDYCYESDFGTPKQVYIKYPLTMYYRTSFNIEETTGEVCLLLDQRTIMGDYKLYLNGKKINKENFKKTFINDQNNRIQDITSLLQSGDNKIEIEIQIEKESDGIRDPLYLIGEFGVNEKQNLINKPMTAKFEMDYTKGFPFYSGTLTFKKEVEWKKDELPEVFSLEFDFKDRCLECIEVLLNGKSLGVRAYTPYQWECRKEWALEGENIIEIKRINTLANMLDGTYFDYQAHQLVEILPQK